MCAANLAKAGIAARSVAVDVEVQRADESPLGVARRFDDPAWRARFAAELAPALALELVQQADFGKCSALGVAEV